MTEIIRLEAVQVRYGPHVALEIEELSVRKGEAVAVLGPNGAGKTTLVESIAGLRPEAVGSISTLGVDPRRSLGQIRREIGLQMQTAVAPSRVRVREWIELFSANADMVSQARELSRRLELDNLQRRFVTQLSGGERQKLSLLTSLVGQPSLLILDETSTGLDPLAREAVWAVVLEQLERGASLILTSHFMDEVEALCDRVLLMDRGLIRTDQPIQKLLSNHAGYRCKSERGVADVVDLPTEFEARPGEIVFRGSREDLIRRLELSKSSVLGGIDQWRAPNMSDVYRDVYGSSHDEGES